MRKTGCHNGQAQLEGKLHREASEAAMAVRITQLSYCIQPLKQHVFVVETTRATAMHLDVLFVDRKNVSRAGFDRHYRRH